MNEWMIQILTTALGCNGQFLADETYVTRGGCNPQHRDTGEQRHLQQNQLYHGS